MNIDYRYLKAFILTAEHASFSKAAELLGIAQSAISRQIRLLEESIGEELIIRSSKKVLLTHKGQELFTAAQKFDSLALSIFQKEDNRPLDVGILHGLVNTWFLPILTKYTKKSSRPINVFIGDKQFLKDGIESGKFDVTFSTENIQSELISSLKLFSEHLVIITKNEINPKKLHDYTWIVYGEEDNLYSLSDKRSQKIISISSIDSIVSLVESGIGIAVVPDHVLRKNHTLTVYEHSDLPSSNIYMTTLNYKTIPSYLKDLSDLVNKRQV